MRKKKLVVFILSILPCFLYGQTPWTLKNCIEFGLRNNRNNKVYANEKRIADAKAREAVAAYLPSVNINGELDDNIKSQSTLIPAGAFSPTPIHLAFGGHYSPSASVQLEQTIYDRALLTSFKSNKYNSEQADLKIRENSETIIYNISVDYYQVYVYKVQLRLQKEDLASYKKQIDVTTLQLKKGVVLQKDLDKLTVNLNNTISRTRLAESNCTLAENQLKYDLGLPIDTALLIDSLDASHLINQRPALRDSASFNATNLVDYRLSQVNERLLEIDEKRIKNGIYPKLTLFMRYGGVGYGDFVSPSFSAINSYSTIGLKLNVPVFDVFRRNAQYDQAKYKRLNALENLELDKGKYQLQYQNARTKLLKEETNLEVEQNNLRLAESVFNVTNLQYQKGTTDLTDWLNAQSSLNDSQNNYLQSLYNLILAQIDLDKAAGSLKNFYNSL